ncbi:MAG: hypothetical protein V4469_02690 [Patescibacteria group bacterium]
MSKKTTIVTLTAAILIITGATFSDRVFASSGGGISARKNGQIKHMSKDNGRAGVVESINGNVINIKTKDDEMFTVDTGNAKFYKARDVEISLSDIQIGDKIFALGPVSNNSIVADKIFSGKKGVLKGKRLGKKFEGVIGTVTSISGNTVTLTAKDNIVYIVDASGAGVKKGKEDSNVSQIKSGDKLFVKGTVSGTEVLATDIMDGSFGGRFKKNK